MKILVDLTSLSYHITGIERYALCVTEEMLKKDESNQYILLFRNEVYPVFSKYIDEKRITAKILHGEHKLAFFQIIMPFNLYKLKADRYMFFAFPNPLLFFNKNIYNTIHDMGRWDCPETKGLHLFYFKTTETIALKRAKKIFTVSEFSKERICSITGRKPEDVIVTYNGISDTLVNANGNYTKVQSKYSLPERYIMFLSTLQPRKNLKLLLEAFSEILDKVDYDLVLIGRVGWKVDDLLEKYGLKNRIVFTGFVDDADVALVYKNALCFVFPTLYEGFGIPPVEALAMGCPVISSDSSCMKEVLQDRAVYFENDNKEDLKQKLLQLPQLLPNMKRSLNAFQKNRYDYGVSAEIIMKELK